MHDVHAYRPLVIHRWGDTGAKWLRFTISKHESHPIHSGDEIKAFITTGWMCDGGSKMSLADFPGGSEIGSLTEDKYTLPGQNIRVADALSNPSEMSGCVILFCERRRFDCLVDARVEFYDRMSTYVFFFFISKLCYIAKNLCGLFECDDTEFGKPPIVPIVAFGLGWGDLITLVCGIVEIFALSIIFARLYGKFTAS